MDEERREESLGDAHRERSSRRRRTAGQRWDSDTAAARLQTAATARSGRGEARRRRRFRTAGRNGAVGTPARGPDSAFNMLERHDAWQPCGNSMLPGGPGAARGV
jgi:hypothetical protein